MTHFTMISLGLLFSFSLSAQKLLDPSSGGGPISIVVSSSSGVNTSVAVAYSIRQLKTTYDHSAITPPSAVSGFTNSSTPLIRVRRSSDNGQLDIGYNGSGNLDTVTVKNFVSDNGTNPTASGYISVFYDQSGNSKDAIQTVDSVQPRIIDAGILEKNGSNVPGIATVNGGYINDGGTTTNAPNGLNRYGIVGDRTVTLVCQPRTWVNGPITSGGGTYLLDRNGSTGSQDKPLTSIKASGNNWGAQIRDSFFYAGSSFTGTIAISTNRSDNVTIIRNGSSYSLFVNGVFAGSSTLSSYNAMTPLKLGYGSNISENIYYGECVLFGSALSNTDLQTLNTSQGNYFGLGTSPIWTGATSTDWNTASNWSNTSVPNNQSNVVIPSGTTNSLNITSGQTTLAAKRLTINSGATVTINGNVSVADSVTINGTISGTGTITTNGSFKQILSGSSTVTLNSLANTNTGDTLVAASNIALSGTLTTGTSSKLNLGTNTLSGTFATSGTGTLMTQNTSGTPLSTGRTWTGTLLYNSSSAQTIVAGNYTNLNGTGGNRTLSSTGTIGISGTFTTGAGSYTVTSSTIDYNNATGGQTITNITYNNLTLSNTSGTQTVSSNLVVNGTFTTTAGGTLSLSTNTLSGTLGTISNNGTISTANTSATPIPTGKNWDGNGTVSYNSASAQTIVNGNYNNLDGTGGNRTLSSTGTIGIIGTFTPGAGTYTVTSSTVDYKNATGGQTVASITYNNLTLSNTSGAQTAAGNMVVNGTLTTTAGGTLALSTNTLTGTLGTISNSGTISTTNTSATPIPTGKTWGGTVTYAATNGAQTVVTGTYNNLTTSNTSGTQTAGGNLIVNGTLTTAAGGTLAFTTNTLTGTLGTISNSGTISTTNTSATPIPTDKTWDGTVTYAATAGAQTVVAGTYNNLTLSNTSGTQTAGSNLIVNGTLTTASGGSLSLSTNTLSGALNSISNNGTISTANTGSTPLSNGKTWGGTGTVSYNSASAQTIVDGNYYNLNGTGGNRTLSSTGTIGVNGTFTLGAGVYTVTSSTVDYKNVSGGQSIADITYNNLTLSNTTGTQTAGGNLIVNGALTTTAGGTLALSNNTLSGTLGTISNNGTISTTNTSATPIPAGKTWGGTIYYASSGSQTIMDGTYNNLQMEDGFYTPAGDLVTNGTLTIATGGLLYTSYTLTGTLTTINNNGTISTLSTASNALASGKTWGGLVRYTAASGGQTVAAGTYNNIFLSNSSGTQTANGNIIINGSLTDSFGGTFDLSTNTLSGAITSISNSGTILTANTSSTPLPSGKIWAPGTVTYNASSGGQSIVGGTYSSLILNNSNGTQTMNGTVTVGGALTLTSGGKLAIGSNTLNINGIISGMGSTATLSCNGSSSLSIAGSGTLGSNLFFDQTTPGTTNKLANFTYNRSAQTITLGNTLQVSGTVTPTAGTLATGNFLTLISNATGTANIANGGCTTCSYISGNVNIQRNIPAVARRWRFVGSNVTSTTLADWKNETYITGIGGAANGFDATLSNQASVYWYNEAVVTGDLNTGWVAATNITNALDLGKGYRLFVRGDRSDVGRLTGSNATQNEVTIDVVGIPNQGDITMPVSFNSSGIVANDGWNLLANPYPSPYDWNAHYDNGGFHANLDPTVWILNAQTGAYDSYNASSNTGGLTGGIIPSGASFWVKANAGSPSLTFKEQFKSASAPVGLFKTEEGEGFSIKLSFDSITSDKVFLKYMDGSTTNCDNYDTKRLAGTVNINAYGADNILLSSSVRPLLPNSVDTIKLSVGGTTGNYTMEFANSNEIAIHENVLLFDTYALTVTDLTLATSYPFSINTTIPASYGLNRFYIVIGNSASLPVRLLHFTAQEDKNETVKLAWSTGQEINSREFEIERSINAQSFETIGSIACIGNTKTISNYQFTDLHPNTNNYYRLKQIDVDGTITYSNIEQITLDREVTPTLNMYPIPAIETITVEHSSKINRLKIYDLKGNTIYSKTLESPAYKASIAILSIRKGVYIMEIEDENGTIEKEKFLKQ